MKFPTLIFNSYFMKKVILAATTLVLLIFSCSPNDSSNAQINIERRDSVSIFDFVDSISVVQLETTKDVLLSRTSGIVLHKNRLYIMSGEKQVIYCFDSKGRFLFKMNNQGRGPQEFTYSGHFNVDPFLDQLMVLVPWGILIYYDLDGNFISKVQLPPDLRAYNEVYAIDKDNLLFFTWGYDFYAYYYSKSTATLSKGFVPTTVDFSMSFPPFRKSYYYKDSLYFNNVGLKNEVLNLSDTTCRSVYSWDFGEKNYTLKQMQDLVEYDLSFRGKTPTKESQLQRFKERHENPKFPAYYSYGGFETDKFRATTLVSGWPGKFTNVIKEKQKRKSYVFFETKEGLKLSFSTTWGNSVIMQYNIEDLQAFKKVLKPEDLKIVESHNPENDNPLYIIYHFK